MTREALAAPEAHRRRSRASRAAARARRRRSPRPSSFLASDRASYLYGEVLSVNGGAVMYD